ncbi:hypothetical protein FP2506_00265 [Fulvimarina pelagi HTCC2506]|uniref:Uncharacterized protein n=1 Tax=Fulvimarina pelagi HTCC2506 TaxID=314231 RepID=Q0FXT2_9HYPH|nr:hypothetical protein FP2506_00265 [Fulvimarina pelagi HTCC2506]
MTILLQRAAFGELDLKQTDSFW